MRCLSLTRRECVCITERCGPSLVGYPPGDRRDCCRRVHRVRVHRSSSFGPVPRSRESKPQLVPRVATGYHKMATVRQAHRACVAVPSLTRRRATIPLQKKPCTVRPRQCALPSRRSYPVSMSSYPALHTSYPALHTLPSPHILPSPPNPIQLSTSYPALHTHILPALHTSYPALHTSYPALHTSYHTSGLAWQWGGTKRACSAVLVLLVGCVLPGGGASTSPAAPTTGASLEGSSDSSSPGRGLSDSMAKVREREATAALRCQPKVLAAGCPKSQVLALIMRMWRGPPLNIPLF